MPGTSHFNYAEVVLLEVSWDPVGQGGQMRATYVVGWLDPVSGAKSVQTGTQAQAAAVMDYLGSDTVASLYAAMGALILRQEAMDATQGDQVIFPSRRFQ